MTQPSAKTFYRLAAALAIVVGVFAFLVVYLRP